MTAAVYHIAQVNIARILAPLDSAIMADFVAQLDEINALADDSPGFIWRLKGEENNATNLRPYDDDRIIVNMSVWLSPEALKDYVYRSAHSAVMRRRREWFEKMVESYYALWWIDAGHIPTVSEARQRLDHLRAHKESAYAFSFRRLYPAPGGLDEQRRSDPVLCEAWGSL